MTNFVSLIISLVLLFATGVGAHEIDKHPDHELLVGGIYPQLSRDGRTIAFSHQGAIWKIPRDGGTMIRLTKEPGFDIEPAWSPGGQWIAFIRSSNFSNGTLQVISSVDGRSKMLPNPVGARDRLFFDKTGERLLGCFNAPDQGVALRWYHMESGELGPELLSYYHTKRYALSQNESRIAYVETRDVPGIEQAGNNGPQATVWSVPAEGGEPVKLFEFPARIHDLAWCDHDEAMIIVTAFGGAHNDLWKIPLEDPEGGAQRITFGHADEDRPTLSQDGRWLLFTDNRLGATQLMVRDQTSGREQQVGVDKRDYGLPTGLLQLDLREEDSPIPVTARVSVSRSGGKYHAPRDAIYRLQNEDLHFYAEGSAALTLPEGHYEITVWRGPEYRVVRQEIDVRPGETSNLSLSLPRWIDQRSRGWYSGESHIHANYGYGHWYNSPMTMLAQCAGEDLVVSNFMVANSDSDGVFDREFFRGRIDPLSTDSTVLYWNEEFRSTIWGHMTLLNLKHLVEPIFTGFAHTTHPHDHPTNGDVARLVHDQSGHVNYTHPSQNVGDPYLGAYTAKALPIDVALGTVDSIDVMGSNHEANMPLWYGLLNCGFQIPASAGTDCFLNRIRSRLPGSVRVYVRMDGPFSYQNWIENLKQGRTFATNGPMLEFTAGGKSLGETVVLDTARDLQVRGEVSSQYPMNKAEVIFNGKVLATFTAKDSNTTSIEIDQALAIPHSGWIALRAYGPRHPDAGTTLFCHSSPIYIQVEGKPQDARKDATYFISWIDRLWSDVQNRDRIPSPYQEHVQTQISTARSVYQKIAEASHE